MKLCKWCGEIATYRGGDVFACAGDALDAIGDAAELGCSCSCCGVWIAGGVGPRVVCARCGRRDGRAVDARRAAAAGAASVLAVLVGSGSIR